MAQTFDQAPPRRSHGCLWGCLALVALIVVGGAGAYYWGGWYLTEGIKASPSLQQAMTVLRANPTAHDVLGDDIQIESVRSENFVSTLGTGRTATYTAELKGSKGEAELHVTMHADGPGKKMAIVAMILTTQDGTRYNLTQETLTPPAKSI